MKELSTEDIEQFIRTAFAVDHTLAYYEYADEDYIHYRDGFIDGLLFMLAWMKADLLREE